MAKAPRRRNLKGTRQYRIIPSRFPPVGLFERLVDPDELEILYAIESLTNDRVRAEAGDLHLVPKEEWVTGAGASVVMAAFTHIGRPSRFSDGSFGVYYASLDIDTAICETVFHTERRLRETDEPAIEIDMRCYSGTIAKPLDDVRGAAYARLQKPALSSWRVTQPFGKKRRDSGSWGLLYKSVRNAGGQCVAAFRPLTISKPRQGKHFRYRWNGSEIDQLMTISAVRTL